MSRAKVNLSLPICLPSDEDFVIGLEIEGISECGVSQSNIAIANAIYGPNKHSVQGKSVQRTNNMPREDQILGVPPSILKHYGEVTVGIDVMHINGVAFLINISKHIKFIQCICIRNKSDVMYVAAVKKMDNIYKLRGFKITTMYADRAFEHCLDALATLGITLICCDKNSHVHFIKRCIRFAKERVRGVRSMLPFKKLPKRLLMEIVYTVFQLMNAVRRKGGVHPTMSARQIVTGKKLIIPPFMPGALVYGVPGGSSNSVEKMRTFEALYLRPNDGGGGHFVYNISTKQINSVPRVIGLAGKAIPMINEIIKTINDQGTNENQPEGLVFGDRNDLTTILDLEPFKEGEEKNPEFDDDYASDRLYEPQDEDSILSDDHDIAPDQYDDEDGDADDGNNEEAGVDEGIANVDGVIPLQGMDEDEQAIEDDDDPMLEDLHEEDDPMLEELHVIEDNDESGKDATGEQADKAPPKKNRGLDDTLDRGYWNPGGQERHCLTVIKGYGNLEANLSTPQYGFKKGLAIFGGPGYDATVKELDDNLIGRDVIIMLNPESVTYDMFRMYLSYLMFLKRKRMVLSKHKDVQTDDPKESTSPRQSQARPRSKHKP